MDRPPPSAIESLGDKVAARQIAAAVGAPMAAGTDGPVSGAAEVDAFVARHGLPIAIKAAFGGGGRGLKVVRQPDEIGEAYESAVREAVAAFGRGECFVERYLDRPRHVETQCLADRHGNVVVVSTRDCSLQRRHQKLVEEAPAPFLSPGQSEQLYQASRAILREAGYVSAGTCEFLVRQDGTVSFLEVNTGFRSSTRCRRRSPHRPGPGNVPHRGRPELGTRPAAARALDRVPHQRGRPRP
jgi:acetyl-CoA/propionyl-CoA carboxylase biotin carboxyl carrier protein